MLEPRVEAEDSPDPANDDESERPSDKLRRDADLLGRRNSECRKWLRKKLDAIAVGFEKQAPRSDKLESWWNIVHCHLDDNQYYDGTAQVYVPAIHDAIEARATRFANQLFPQSGKYVDAESSDGGQPYEILALLNHYVRGTDSEMPLKTHIVKPLFKCADIEGHMNLYVDWDKVERLVVSRETRGITLEGMPQGEGQYGAGNEITDIVEEEIDVGFPGLEIIHDADVLVLPATSDTVLQALQKGGSATIVRRWTKEQAEELADDGLIDRELSDDDAVKPSASHASGMVDLAKALAKAVGVRVDGAWMTAMETWLMVPLNEKGAFSKGGKRRLCRLYWNLMREPLGLRRNPYWNDRCPLLSIPVEKVPGVFKGASKVEPLAPIQYEINDAANERADVDHMSAMPIIRRSAGEQGNRPLIIAPAAVWDGGPNDIQFMEFPNLSDRAKSRIVDGIQVIFQSLGVNPSMLPQQLSRARSNQAQVAQEQQVDLLTTAEAVSGMEHLLNEVCRWFVDLDHQFRNRELTVRQYGKMGIMANMISVGPIQNGTQYQFTWCGAEQARMNAAMMQQGTALINVARGLEQNIKAEGKQLRLSPILERSFANLFGPELASLTLVDQRHMLSVDPETENQMLAEGHAVATSQLDNPQQHLQSHQQAIQQMGDPHGTIRVHIQMHLLQLAEQNKAQMMAQAGAQGVPGGAGPGVAGTPRQGAQPGQTRQQGPPGMIHQDQLPRGGAPVPPRRA